MSALADHDPAELSLDTVATVSHVSKKFCKKLKRSLALGLRDIARELVGCQVDLTLGKDEFLAVDDVSFDVKVGECVGLLGRNGSGKSTTLKMLAGLLKPDGGTIAVRGRVSPLIELGTGFNPILSGRENVYVNAAVQGIPAREVRRLFDRIVEFAEIGDFIDAPLRTYSSGMSVRLGFAVATQLKPDLLIVDEVLAVGDIAFRNKCLAHLQALKREGTAIVLVSHSNGQIQALCERTIVFEGGRAIASLPAKEGIVLYEKRLKVHEDAQKQLTRARELSEAASVPA